jgi:nucleoid-associated protein YgaU
MKKIIILSIFILFVATGLFAQASLFNNQYYQKSVEYEKLSKKSFDSGEYDEATEYALKAQEYAALSKQYIAEQVLAFRARTALNAARDRMRVADRLNIKNRDSELYASASGYYQNANSKFNAKDYENSIADSQRVLELLKDIAPVAATATPAGGLAATYKVKLNVQRRDSLWRIAGFDYIYGDPFKWPVLYEANKHTFPQPNNPHLIHPGMILQIPSIKGETRSGER